MLVPLFIPGQKRPRSGNEKRTSPPPPTRNLIRGRGRGAFFRLPNREEIKIRPRFFCKCSPGPSGEKKRDATSFGVKEGGRLEMEEEGENKWEGASFAKLTQLIVGLRELEKGLWGPPPLSYPHPPSQGDPPAFAHGDAKTQPSATLAKRGGRDLWGQDLCSSTKFHTGKYLHQSSDG